MRNVNSDGLNEADEMNLYVPNAQLDSPFGYGDLEWLYRQQDVDGGSLVSRLAQLAPISFSNTVDGQRRRRLFALDSWETNNFVWANDNPPSTVLPTGVFPNNSRFTPVQDASFLQLSAEPRPSSRQRHPDRRAARPADSLAGPPRQENQPQLPATGL